MEKDHVHIKNDALEDSTTSENAVCEDFSDSLSDDSLVIWPTSLDVTEKEGDSNSIVHNAIAKAKTH